MSMGAQLISESHFLEKQGIKDLFPAQKSIVRFELELSAQTLEHLIEIPQKLWRVSNLLPSLFNHMEKCEVQKHNEIKEEDHHNYTCFKLL
ncbi:unnamed protein product [Sphagnum jensenii]|uniref:Uncharacterized protein n=1 Tax=Sphagnum jensenii TaxID=128206 RepID=A0ABP0VKU2_9BRYO